MERLSRVQISALRGAHKSHPKNRSKFFDCVSLVTLRGKLTEEKRDFLREMTKHSLDARVRLTNG